MELEEVRTRLDQLETELDAAPVAAFATFRTPHGELQVAVTARLRQKCRKGRVWKSAAMLTALKNAAYGFDRKAPRSRGGADGIFSVDRNYFTRKLDVSHPRRLLGVLSPTPAGARLVLVDYDQKVD